MQPATTAKIIDLGVVRAERARQKRRAELAAARHSGRFSYVAPAYPLFGHFCGFHGITHTPVPGLSAIAVPCMMVYSRQSRRTYRTS